MLLLGCLFAGIAPAVPLPYVEVSSRAIHHERCYRLSAEGRGSSVWTAGYCY